MVSFLPEERERPAGTSGSTQALEEQGTPLRRGMRRYAWRASMALQPQEAVRWPLWVHPRDRGPFNLHLSLYYEPVTPVEGMKHRYAASCVHAAMLSGSDESYFFKDSAPQTASHSHTTLVRGIHHVLCLSAGRK